MADLDYFAQDFLLKLISTNAQWVNKPKFHMLIHLRQSIERFGPTSLFATEKYESYNGVVQQASIHSNRQSPFHDIATSFQNYAALRFSSQVELLRQNHQDQYCNTNSQPPQSSAVYDESVPFGIKTKIPSSNWDKDHIILSR
ncbi:hypothetical protein BY996DRAFT_8690975 [Phakopsora pachyrhizi]|nr:hypothetical protein BY996DRAFT_8690975 [Phakopsora pachyrhizi]